MRCLPDAIEALAALGRPDEAEPRSSARPGGRCRGLVLAARGDHEAALAALEQAAACDELPFERARTLLALGTEQRRARQRRAARATLEAALASLRRRSAPRCGARRHAPSSAGSAGALPPTGELTPAERRVAELVAAGRTNREVAETLVLSVHTVEAALTQAYRKLGVRSRTELARLYR